MDDLIEIRVVSRDPAVMAWGADFLTKVSQRLSEREAAGGADEPKGAEPAQGAGEGPRRRRRETAPAVKPPQADPVAAYNALAGASGAAQIPTPAAAEPASPVDAVGAVAELPPIADTAEKPAEVDLLADMLNGTGPAAEPAASVKTRDELAEEFKEQAKRKADGYGANWLQKVFGELKVSKLSDMTVEQLTAALAIPPLAVATA